MTAGALVAAPSLLRGLSAPTGKVAIGQCPAYNGQVMDTLAKMFDQLGGLQKLVGNKTVTIKLNMTGGPTTKLNGMPVEMTHWSHPTVIGATVALLGKAGAKRIRIVESHNGPDISLQQFMLNAGWNPNDFSSAAKGVEFENTNFLGSYKEYARFMVPGSPKMYAGYDMNAAYRDTDVMVSLAKLKDHRVAGITLSMKNMFGILPTTIYGATAGVDEPSPTIVPGARAGTCHSGDRLPSKSAPPAIEVTSHDPGYRMPHLVPELVAARPIHLAIIDGISSIEGGELPSRAPGAGRPKFPGAENLSPAQIAMMNRPQSATNAVNPGVLIAGFNPVCTDSVATAVMGYDPMAERGTAPFELCDSMLGYAEALGLGTRDLKRIDIVGTPIAKARFQFHSVKQLTPA